MPDVTPSKVFNVKNKKVKSIICAVTAVLLIATICTSGCMRRANMPMPELENAYVAQWKGRDPLIAVTIGSQVTRALVDSGYNRTIAIPFTQLEEFGLHKGVRSGTAISVSGPSHSGSIENLTVEVGGDVMQINDADAIQLFEPLIGLAWLTNHRAIIDCRHRLVAWPKMGAASMPAYEAKKLRIQGYDTIPLRRYFDLLWVPVLVDRHATWFMVDTGFSRLTLDIKLATKYGISRKHPAMSFGRSSDPSKPRLTLGQTNYIHLRIGEIDHLCTLNTLDLSKINNHIMGSSQGESDSEQLQAGGVLSIDFMLAHDAILDPANDLLFLRK